METTNFENQTNPVNPIDLTNPIKPVKNNQLKFLILVVAILVVLIAAGGVYLFFVQKNNKTNNSSSTSISSQNSNSSVENQSSTEISPTSETQSNISDIQTSNTSSTSTTGSTSTTQSTSNNQPTLTITPSTKKTTLDITPDKITLDFYQDYVKKFPLTYKNNTYLTQSLINYLDESVAKNKEITPYFDPVLIAEDIPVSFTVKILEQDSISSTVILTENFSSKQEIKVGLIIVDGQWKINLIQLNK